MIIILYILIALLLIAITIFIYLKFKPNESIKTNIVLPKNISQDILIRLSMIEKKLLANSFIRQMILEVTIKRKKELVFYYFNTIDKIHLIVTYRNRRFNYFIFSILNNNKILVTPSCVDCVKDSSNITLTSYGESSMDKILEHKIHKKNINQSIKESKLTYDEVAEICKKFISLGP